MTAAEPEMPKLFETGKHCHDGQFLRRLIISKCNFNHGIFALIFAHDARMKQMLANVKH
jgi:hypothetical protein